MSAAPVPAPRIEVVSRPSVVRAAARDLGLVPDEWYGTMMLVEALRSILAGATRHLPRRESIRSNWRKLNRAFLKMGAKPGVTFTTRSGLVLQVDLQAKSQIDSYYTGEHEPESMAAALSLYDPDCGFVDVGSAIGFFATAVAHKIQRERGRGRVFCFEPLPMNLQWLRANLQANNLLGVCDLFQIGLSDRKQTLPLLLRDDFRNGSATGSASLSINGSADSGFESFEVPLDSLDSLYLSLIPAGTSLDFVHLDIEGHEDCFFRGAIHTLLRHRPTLLMELNHSVLKAKQVDLDIYVRPLLPPDPEYRIFYRRDGRWLLADHFANCGESKALLLIPAEKLPLDRYTRFLHAAN